ncbi:MAG: phasin family protein [Methylovirgula sp.]
MEIHERRSKTALPLDWPVGGYSVATKTLQLLAEDISNISAANFERNTKLVEDLRGARTVEDLVSIQTKFMAAMFDAFNENVRLMGSRLADLRNGIAEAPQGAPAASPAPAEAARPLAATSLDQAFEASNVATLASLKASQEMTRSAFEAAEKAAETISSAARNAFSGDAVPPASKSSGS